MEITLSLKKLGNMVGFINFDNGITTSNFVILKVIFMYSFIVHDIQCGLKSYKLKLVVQHDIITLFDRRSRFKPHHHLFHFPNY